MYLPGHVLWKRDLLDYRLLMALCESPIWGDLRHQTYRSGQYQRTRRTDARIGAAVIVRNELRTARSESGGQY